jgi:hypothetical protein
MTTLRVVAMLLVANSVILVAGVLGGGGSRGSRRPIWISPLWIRAGVPLAVAGGLWFGQEWAWWAGVAMTAGLLAWMGVASFVLALGGYFTMPGAAFQVLYFCLLAATWLTALVLLLFSGLASN